MMNKKGFELAINFLVILIISIAVIGLGIRFVYKIVSETSQLQKISGEELDQKIGDLLCADDLKVCVGIERKKISRGKADVFGLKILNIGPSKKTFDVYVQVPKLTGDACGYNKNNGAITDCDKIKVIHGDLPPITTLTGTYVSYIRSLDIDLKKEKTIAIAFETNEQALSGTYIFNIKVKYRDTTASPSYDTDPDYVTTKKIYVEVP